MLVKLYFMKVFPFNIVKSKNVGLIYQEDKVDYFYDKLHQHNEIQICFIEKGEGTLIVGDTINDFKVNDIFVFGSNLPHVFLSDKNKTTNSVMYSLFFTKSSFGDYFFELDDFKSLIPFFIEVTSGIKVLDNKKEIIILFKSLNKASDLQKFIKFMEILELINLSKRKTLAKFIYSKKYSNNEGDRMRKIMEFTFENFVNSINLKKVSDISNMSINSFCRYFKQRTNKTYFTFLNELRVDFACRLLVQNKQMSITEIAYNSGFENLSNFNRKFKEIKKVTPSKYRKIQKIN